MIHKTGRIEDQFLKYVLPSMLVMLLSGFFTIIDGFFVGRAIGDSGLAAINIAWPIPSVILALGTGIGTGGAIWMSIKRGEGDHAAGDRARGNAIGLLLFVCALLPIVLLPTYPQILTMLGARGDVRELAMDYTRTVIFGGGFQVLAVGLAPILRNNHKPVAAMVIMIGGLLINIVLDWLFIMALDWSVSGAALATIIAQAFTAVMSALMMLLDKGDRIRLSHFRPTLKSVRNILRLGVSPFGLSLAPSVIIIFNNLQCLKYGGDPAVAAYAVLSYVLASAQLLLSGVGEGMQPLISFCSGSKQHDSMHILRRKGVLFMLGVSAVIMGLMLALRPVMPQVFGTSQEAGELVKRAVLICFGALPFLGFARLSSSYFSATGDSLFSLSLIYLDPLVFTPILLWLLPRVWNMDGVWAAYPAAQLILTLLAFGMHHIHNRDIRREDSVEQQP